MSNDPRFEEKLQDVVGLYLDPPENAVVFSFDEKSSVQALDRTQPGLPLKPGRCGTMTHDYKRNGTTSLFVALEVASGRVIGETYRRHRHQEVSASSARCDRCPRTRRSTSIEAPGLDEAGRADLKKVERARLALRRLRITLDMFRTLH